MMPCFTCHRRNSNCRRWSGTIVINIQNHYDDKLHHQLILSVGFVIKQIVFKFFLLVVTTSIAQSIVIHNYVTQDYYYCYYYNYQFIQLIKSLKNGNTIKIALPLDKILCLTLGLIPVQLYLAFAYWIKNYNERQEKFKIHSKTKEKYDA